MPKLATLHFRSAKAWREWLERHHASSPGIWVVFYKGHTRKKSVGHEDMVRGALCFGWIDSLVKRLDDDRYAIKVTPRKTASKWSDLNRRRWAELEAAGLLAPAGLAAAPTSNTYAAKPAIPELPGYIAEAFRKDPRAWKYFQTLAPGYRRHFVAWIHAARRADTRERRIQESVRLLASGKKLGLK